jgi:hypothetical protein
LSGGGTSARLRQTALGQKQQQKIKDEDLTQNPPQGSLAQQIFPLIPERFLKPPLNFIQIHNHGSSLALRIARTLFFVGKVKDSIQRYRIVTNLRALPCSGPGIALRRDL